jgi:hypothetical protein
MLKVVHPLIKASHRLNRLESDSGGFYVIQVLDRCSQSVNYSRMSLTSIQKEIVYLSSTERAMLIDILWESLDEARVKEIEGKWAAESEERIDSVDRGEMATVDGPSAIQELRSSPRNDIRF